MPSQDDYLDDLLKGMSEEENGGIDLGGSPDLDAVAEMTEEEIAKLLAVGAEEPEGNKSSMDKPSQESDDSLNDVLAMLEGTSNSNLQEIKELLQKSDNNELVDESNTLEGDDSQVDKLLADIEGAGSEETALNTKEQRKREKQRRKEEKLAQKEAKKAERKAAKGKKGTKGSGKGGKSSSESDTTLDYDVLDNIVSGAGRIAQGNSQKAGAGNNGFEMSAEDAIIEVEREEADDILPDIEMAGEMETDEPKEKGGLFAKFMAFLMEEEEEEEPENENLRLSKENQDIIDELDKENGAAKGGKSKKDKKKKKEKPKKEPKPKKAPKPKKEKPPKEEEPVIPGSKLTLKKVMPIVLLGASVGAVILIFINISVDFSDKSVAKDAYQQGDYATCYRNLYGKKLNEEEALMYGRAESILYIELWYRKYEIFVEQGDEVKALDSLIQTVCDYPALFEYANQWNAADEVNVVYSKILNILQDKYGITEGQALEIAAEKSDLEYTKIVTAVANGMSYDVWNNGGTPQQPEEEGLPNQLPEESDIGEGDFVDNQR